MRCSKQEIHCEKIPLVKLFSATVKSTDIRKIDFALFLFSRKSRRNESEGKASTSNASLSVSLCKCQAVCQGDLHTLGSRPFLFPAYDLCGIMSRHNLPKKLPLQLYSGFLFKSQSRERLSRTLLSPLLYHTHILFPFFFFFYFICNLTFRKHIAFLFLHNTDVQPVIKAKSRHRSLA